MTLRTYARATVAADKPMDGSIPKAWSVSVTHGGLTTLTKTLDGKPDQVQRVIKALQQAKESLIGSRERS